MKPLISLLLVAGAVSCALPAPASTAGNAVAVEIRTDDGRSLPFYPARYAGGNTRVYAEAAKGQQYRIVLRNNLDRRVGVVVAVDGRNIISGGKSWLRNNERMYILEPYQTAEFGGWRSSQEKINRFYFTEVPDSYAAAFGDESAMGVIAVATFPEVRHQPPPPPISHNTWGYDSREDARQKAQSGSLGGAADRAPAAAEAPKPSMERDASRAEAKKEAGTGYGREEYSPTYTVAFEPESSPREKTFIKYEWRETLCRLGIIRDYRPQPPQNRLWDDGYAPPPPRRW